MLPCWRKQLALDLINNIFTFFQRSTYNATCYMLIAPCFHFPLPFLESSACEKLHSPWSLRSPLASKCFRASSSRKVGTRTKKKGMMGEGEGKERNACPQTPSLRTADVYPVVASVPPKKGGREATTGSTSALRRQANPTILKNCVRPQTQLLIGEVLILLIT